MEIKDIIEFNCRKADDMYNSILAGRVRYLKETGGRSQDNV